jgi:hypothetical protein
MTHETEKLENVYLILYWTLKTVFYYEPSEMFFQSMVKLASEYAPHNNFLIAAKLY